MALNELKVRNSKPSETPVKLPDEKGLFILVHPNGSKYWRFRFSFNGKEKVLALGVYPDVTLASARNQRDIARRQIADGIDPSFLKQTLKRETKASAENTFEAVAREWHTKHSKRWVSSHSEKLIRRLEKDVFPWIGSRPIAELTAPELLSVLRHIEERGAVETAHRALQNCGQVFRYAVATGKSERNPSGDLKGALPPTSVKHYPAITEPSKVGELLRAIEGYDGSFITKCALRLAPLVFVRPGELRRAEWAEINLELAEWNIPASKMKMGQPHFVPLSQQAIAILLELYALTGKGKYLFPCLRISSRPMSENTINSALRRLGYRDITAHGFRAMARTILDETLGFRPDIIEHQLAHAVKDPNGRAYNRTSHLPERREMMQKWADYLVKFT